MFVNLFRRKNEIEEKVKQLQNKYLNQLRIHFNEQDHENFKNIEKTKDFLLKKQESLIMINKDYKVALMQFKELSDVMSEAESMAFEVNNYLDQFCKSQELDYPEDICSKYNLYKLSEEKLDQKEEEEADEGSDKENNKDTKINEYYFSPNILIRKSLLSDIEAYTPALKNKSYRSNEFSN